MPFRILPHPLTFAFLLLGILPVNAADPASPPPGTATNLPLAGLQSASPARSLAMLLQVVRQLEVYVRTRNLSSIHNEDEILGAAASELMAQASQVNPGQAEEFKKSLTTFFQKVSRLHLAADLSRQAQSETALNEVLESFSRVKDYFPPRILKAAQPGIDTFTCPNHPDVFGVNGDLCPRCGAQLDQFCRILPAGSGFLQAGERAIQATATVSAPLTMGQPVVVTLRLQRPNGIPIVPADLIETHTERIHALVVDGSLTDYHHEHPKPSKKPGESTFTFTPQKLGPYRVWLDVRTYPMGLQEYVMVDLTAPTSGEPLADRTPRLTSTVDGLNFELIPASEKFTVGRPVPVRLRITSADGRGVTNLEPTMQAFAHVVGFNEDHRTVLHLHPKGPPAEDPAARGGPELELILYALRLGFHRVFAQVQIDGTARYAPFGIQVDP